MLARTARVQATDGKTVHISTWAVYRITLIKIGGIELASQANIELQQNGYFKFGVVSLELMPREKSSKFD